jgi:hypothetical protein
MKDAIVTHNSTTKKGHYTIILEGSGALEFRNSIKLFHIDARIAIPTAGYVSTISSEDYKINISDVEIIIKDDYCIELDTARSNPINIGPICLADLRMIVLSPYNFSAKLKDRTINYSIGLD